MAGFPEASCPVDGRAARESQHPAMGDAMEAEKVEMGWQTFRCWQQQVERSSDQMATAASLETPLWSSAVSSQEEMGPGLHRLLAHCVAS